MAANKINLDGATAMGGGFPEEMVEEILLRLPTKSHLRARCNYPKNLLTLLLDYHIRRLHPNRDHDHTKCTLNIHSVRKTRHGFEVSRLPFIEIRELKSPSSNSDADHHRHQVGSCHGLLYITEFDNNGPIVLANPVKGERQRVLLPPSMIHEYHINVSSPRGGDHHRSIIHGLGFDVSIHKFKMVCVIQNWSTRSTSTSKEYYYTSSLKNKYNFNIVTLVRTLGTDSEWRKIPKAHQTCPISGTAPPIFLHGFLPWLVCPTFVTKKEEQYLKSVIVTFDVEEEYGLLEDHNSNLLSKTKRDNSFQVFDPKGELGMLDSSIRNRDSRSSFVIWLMEDYEKKVWIRKYHIYPPASFGENQLLQVIGIAYGEEDDDEDQILLESPTYKHVFNFLVPSKAWEACGHA